jgi:hypothetical protein
VQDYGFIRQAGKWRVLLPDETSVPLAVSITLNPNFPEFKLLIGADRR